MDQGIKALVESAHEVLNYAIDELEKALKLKDMMLYRNAADKAFLALIMTINAYITAKTGIVPRNHSERRRILREIGREDLRALYSDLMRTLHDEAFYEGIYEPDEVKYAINKIRDLLNEVSASLT